MHKAFELTKIVRAPIEVVYAVAAEVEKYPQFIAHIVVVQVIDKTGNEQQIKMVVRNGPVKQTVVSTAAYQKYKEISFRQLDGPFRDMHGEWLFAPVEGGTKVIFRTEVEIDGYFAARIIIPTLQQQSKRFLQVFVERVESIASGL